MSDDDAVSPAMPAPGVALPGALPEFSIDAIAFTRDLGRLLALGEETAIKVQALLDQHRLLQGQLSVMERQLDGMSLVLLKTGRALLPPDALRVSEEHVDKTTKEFLEKQDEEIDKIIEARGGDHPPTPEEMAAAAAEAMK